MSFLEPNIFIPRKDNIIGLSCEESSRALRSNWLTIERFLNQGLWSAAMSQSTAQPVGAANTGVPETLTNFSSLWTAKTSAVDIANSRFALPAPGIYEAKLELDFIWTSTTGSGSADQATGEIFASSSAATPHTATVADVVAWPWNSADHFQVALTFKASAVPCYVTAGATVATPSTHAPSATAITTVFSLVRIGSIPSAVQ